MEQKKKGIENTVFNFAGKRLLLVEDHPMNITVVQRQLEGKRLQVDVAANGQIAVDMFLEAPAHYYSIIIMDIRMPVMDGIQATKVIRACERADAKTIPILAMTVNGYEEDKEETYQAGMNEHMVKPVTTEVLCEKIKKWIA